MASGAAELILIGIGIVGVGYFAKPGPVYTVALGEAYEEEGASSFVVELSGLSDEELDRIAAEVRQLGDVSSVDLRYNGVELGPPS